MTINWWTLALQAVNVLILVWLLSWLFWRPVAAAIAKRRDFTQDMLDDAKATQTKVDAALADISESRAGIAAERSTLLAEAMDKAETAAKVQLTDAKGKAETLLTTAKTSIERDTAAARKDNAAQASALAVEIAAKLLARFKRSPALAEWLERLVQAIEGMSLNERTALVASSTQIEVVTATEPGSEDRAEIEEAVTASLGGAPKLTFITDPSLLAGLELRSAHLVLHNSWRADLAAILEEMTDAA
ncbi:F0F1 ATP synthase subunit delta [Rhizobium sp. R86522]|uniref:F0F1 ATP synthase subunit delta n=1 Tax=Rhizobium sp. R86522 TaxID=3093861 RepID=UPI00366D970D